MLAVLTVAMSFAGGHLGPTRQKLLVVFTVAVFHAIILCQYVGCSTPAGCDARGTFRFFLSFVLSFSIGACISMAATIVVFPLQTAARRHKMSARQCWAPPQS